MNIHNFNRNKCGRKSALNPDAYTVSQLKGMVKLLVGKPVLPILTKERYNAMKTSKERMCAYLRQVANNNNAAVNAPRVVNNNAAVNAPRVDNLIFLFLRQDFDIRKCRRSSAHPYSLTQLRNMIKKYVPVAVYNNVKTGKERIWTKIIQLVRTIMDPEELRAMALDALGGASFEKIRRCDVPKTDVSLALTVFGVAERHDMPQAEKCEIIANKFARRTPPRRSPPAARMPPARRTPPAAQVRDIGELKRNFDIRKCRRSAGRGNNPQPYTLTQLKNMVRPHVHPAVYAYAKTGKEKLWTQIIELVRTRMNAEELREMALAALGGAYLVQIRRCNLPKTDISLALTVFGVVERHDMPQAEKCAVIANKFAVHERPAVRPNANVFDPNKCKRMSMDNPEPYNIHDLRRIARGKGLTDERMRERGAYTSKKRLCEMIKDKIRGMNRGNDRPNAQSPRQRQMIQNFMRGLPNNHPAKGANVGERGRVWAKLQLGIPLTRNDAAVRRTTMFRNIINRAEEFDIRRLTQLQMNEPEIREDGLEYQGNNWKPEVGKNVNNAETMENDIFLGGDVPTRNKAVYIKNNVLNRKIKTVYDLNGLKTWLRRQRVSPVTRARIETWNSVKLVPTDIYMKHANDTNKAIEHGASLQRIRKTKYVKRVMTLLKDTSTKGEYMRKEKELAHVRTEQNFQNLKKSCAVYLSMLYVHVMGKRNNKERVDTLKRLDDFNPVCVENLCSYIAEFISHDDNNFIFEFDPKATKTTNMSNCANAFRNSFCAMLKKGEINETVFRTKMERMSSKMDSILRNKDAVDGVINKSDIDDFLENYGDMLLDCPNTKLRDGLFDDFVFNRRRVGD